MPPAKYILTPPEDLHPLSSKAGDKQMVYPDFEPWSHTEVEDKLLLSYVSKGHYNGAKVNFESISARSSLQESLPKVAGMLAEQFSKVLHLREQTINKVSSKCAEQRTNKSKFIELSGPGFTLPNRVTLTDQRRSQWLQEFGSPNVSLSKLANSIPHGLKRKQILEQCYLKQIPIQRAIWLIKSSYSMEWKSLMNKLKPGQTSESITNQLYNLWTNNMVSIMEKLVFEMPKYYNDNAQLKTWKLWVSYYIDLLGNCYSGYLIDKGVFNHWLVEFIEKVENFEFLPLSLHILSVFWKGICPLTTDADCANDTFLISKITAVLLQKYHIVSNCKSMINDENCIINDLQRNSKLKESILLKLKSYILDIFHSQSLEAFIMPNQNWDMYKSCLYEIIGLEKDIGEQSTVIKKKLELITYRNDSLKFNTLSQCLKGSSPSYESRSSSDLDSTLDMHSILLSTDVDPEITSTLDNYTPGYDWSAFVQQKFTSMEQISQMILWAVNPSRKSRYESAHLIAKLLLLKMNCPETLQEFNMEDMIWKLVFQFSKLSDRELNNIVNLPRLFEVLNIFISYGIIKVPTYIRKLISSGIMYIPDSNDKFFHCNILINLKVSPLMKNQYNMVLKNIMEYDPMYFTEYNYERLQTLLAQTKEQMLQDNFENLSSLPSSIRFWVSEWYLSYSCSSFDECLKPVGKATVIRNFTIFGIKLKEMFHFYKWVEFIVYHQLLADVEALSVLVDVLLCYENLLPLLINDLILFMKTLIHIHSKELSIKDKIGYEIFEFNHFWKFFMRNFPYLVEIDSELQLQLVESYDLERSRLEKFTKSNSDVIALYCIINDISEENTNKYSTSNFPSIFQQNLKILLKSEDLEAQNKAHKGLLLLLYANIGDYNKFLSIFLKRKDFSTEQLIKLISLKLLSLDLINKVIGDKFLQQIIKEEVYDYGLHLELHKKKFIRKNLKLVTSLYQDSGVQEDYQVFLNLLVDHGSSLKLQEQTASIICNSLVAHKGDYSLIADLLRYGVPAELFCREDIITPTVLYKQLNFTNIWIFQALTKYYTEALLQDTLSDGQTINNFVFEIIDLTNYDILCSHVFNMVTQVDVVERLLQDVEADFFEKCLSDQPDDVQFLAVMIETIMTLSRKVNNGTIGIPMNQRSYDLLQKSMEKFRRMNKDALWNAGTKLNIYLKIFIVHQKFIFHKICNALNQNDGGRSDLVASLRELFEKTGFNLKLKLLLYDILSSLKSFVIYESTKKGESIMGLKKIQLPQELQNLPPFHISSFLDDDILLNRNHFSSLGIIEHDFKPEKNDRGPFFLFNKKTKEYEAAIGIEPFQLLINYQRRDPGANGDSFNDTALSLSLFDARFDKKNPT